MSTSGICLGPLLVSYIYIDDIVNTLGSKISLYADDWDLGYAELLNRFSNYMYHVNSQ